MMPSTQFIRLDEIGRSKKSLPVLILTENTMQKTCATIAIIDKVGND